MAVRRPASPLSADLPGASLVRVARIGADGDGIAEPGPLYVPFTLPGERVRAVPVGRRHEGFSAIAEAVLTPSAERVAPPCPHFGACGGCALQHWAMAPYLDWKIGLLAAALRRAGYPDAVLAPISPTPPRTRRRVDLAIRRGPGGLAIGLHRVQGREIVDIVTCDVLDPALVALIPALRGLLKSAAMLKREASAVINLLDTGPDLLLRTDAAPDANYRTRFAEFAQRHGLARIHWAMGNGLPEAICTLRPARIEMSGVQVTPPAGAFLQASPAAEAAIRNAVVAGLPTKRTAKSQIAELFAGCGTLSFAMAPHMRVAAFEGDAPAAASLQDAANQAGLAGRVQAHLRDLVRQPLSAKELSAFACVVLDPPFGGALDQIGLIAASTVKRVLYVSCNPVALARDAAILHAAGFSLLSATPVDQFLWSARLESVCVFSRERNS